MMMSHVRVKAPLSQHICTLKYVNLGPSLVSAVCIFVLIELDSLLPSLLLSCGLAAV